ncbi:type I-E CRISPR-associated protein Cse1/CasA [Spirillospora sp. NPDC127200]
MASETYDLLEEGWIPVLDMDGRTRLVGLAEAISEAHRWRWIDAEAPVVTAVLHRLLLAFAHRVYGPCDEAEWGKLWDAHAFPEDDRWNSYLQQHRRAFDLFGERPFFQSPGIPDSKFGTAAKLTMFRATGSNATLFDHTVADERVELRPDEAARWLVTVQAYDTGGTKTPFDKDKSSAPGLGNSFAAALLEGRTLKETLLLNMPVYSPEFEFPRHTHTEDAPLWERAEPPGPEPVKEGPPPAGWTELLTWPSRRIRLRAVRRGDGIWVDGVAILPGTRLGVPLADVEQMAAFRRKKPPAKDGKPPTFAPPTAVTLESLRGIWRHSTELLLPAEARSERIRPRTLDHVADMAGRGFIPSDHVYTLRVFGQRLNSQGGAVHAWFQETLPVPVALLRADQRLPALEQLLGHAVELADKVGAQLDRLERRYAEAMGEPPPKANGPKRHLISQWYWPALEAPFGRMLRDLGAVLGSVPVTAPPDEVPRLVARRMIGLFDAWGARVRRTATDARHRWVVRTPRKPGREHLVLAGLDGACETAIRLAHRHYGLSVRNYLPLDGEEGE